MSEKQALMTLKHPFLVMMMATYKSKDYLYFLLEPGACDVVRCMCVCMFFLCFFKKRFLPTHTHSRYPRTHTHSRHPRTHTHSRYPRTHTHSRYPRTHTHSRHPRTHTTQSWAGSSSHTSARAICSLQETRASTQRRWCSLSSTCTRRGSCIEI
jgi:hypothetical protein